MTFGYGGEIWTPPSDYGSDMRPTHRLRDIYKAHYVYFPD